MFDGIPWHYWAAIVVVVIGFVVLRELLFSPPHLGKPSDAWREKSSRWATIKDVAKLRVGRRQPAKNRIRLGFLGKKLLAAERNRSLMVLAPSGAGKTPRVVVPVVLTHDGPAVVSSVKADVLHLTYHHRATQGAVWVFDPTRSTPFPTCRWSPLLGINTYSDAERAATWLCESSKVEGRPLEGQQYWDSLGKKCLAPLLFAAAKTGRSMADVGMWVNNSVDAALEQMLETLGDARAKAAWKAHTSLEHRAKSSVLGTAWVILESWTSDTVAASVDVSALSEEPILDIQKLMEGNNTLYLVAPASEQSLYAPIFETLVNAILRHVETAAATTGLPQDPSLLLALDEAANIAPLRRLDQVASKGANEGILLVSVWQDVGQIIKIYGHDRARTVRSNHWAQMFLPGINDEGTLRELSQAIGEDTVDRSSVSYGRGGGSRSIQLHDALVAPPAWLRRLPADQAIVISGRYPAIRLYVPGWFEDRGLRKLVDPEVAAQFDAMFQTRRKWIKDGRLAKRN